MHCLRAWLLLLLLLLVERIERVSLRGREAILWAISEPWLLDPQVQGNLEITRSLNFQNLPGDLRTTRVCRTTTDGRQQRTRTTTDNTDTTVPYSTPRRTTHRPRAQGELPNRRHSSCGPDDDRDSTRLAVHPTWRSHAVRGDSIRAHGTRAGCARLSLDGIWTDIPLFPTTQQMRDNATEGARQHVAQPECCATSSATLMRWLCQRICMSPAQAEPCRRTRRSRA